MLRRLERWFGTPMLVLGFVWLGLLVIEFTRGLTSLLQGLGTAIWIIFIADFLVKLTLAPAKLRYVPKNWLTLLALVVPALCVFRIVRVAHVRCLARSARGLRLVRVFS